MSALMNFSPSGAVAPFDRDRAPRHHLAERQRGDPAGRGHARQRRQPFPQLPVGLQDRVGVVVLPAGHRQLERQHVARIESRRDVLQMREAADQQTRADEEHDRQREFRDDEQPAQVLAAAPDGAARQPIRGSRPSGGAADRAPTVGAPAPGRISRLPAHETAIVKSSTRQSMAISWSRGTLASPSARIPSGTERDSSRPTTPPRVASTRLSVSSCRTMRQRLAPSAARTAISRCRASAARQQQVRDVRARDQQHERDRRHKHDAAPAARGRPSCSWSGSDAERQAAVRRIEVGMLAPQPRGQDIQLGSAPARSSRPASASR